MMKKLIFLILLIALISRDVGGKGGFRGGGGIRSGSRGGFRGTSGSGNTGYRGGMMGRSSGMRWSSFGTGMIAYAAMSNLARAGHGYHGGSYNGYNSYPNHRPNGEFCVNNENFNGTQFGKFQCPLPGFNPREKYCCGDGEMQYCCKYWDDSGRQFGTLFGILFVILAIVGISWLIMKLVNKRRLFKHEDNIYSSNPNAFYNMQHVQQPNGQNMGPRPMGPRPMGPNMGPRPMGQNMGPRPMGPNMGPGPMGQNMGSRPMGPNMGPGPMGQNMGPRPVGPRPMGPNMGPGSMGPKIGFKENPESEHPLLEQTPYPASMMMPQPPTYTDATKKD